MKKYIAEIVLVLITLSLLVVFLTNPPVENPAPVPEPEPIPIPDPILLFGLPDRFLLTF